MILLLKFFESFYGRHKSIFLYLLFGGISFFLNIALFAILNSTMNVNELVANIIAWILCVLFQFFTNRSWVFDGKVNTKVEFIKQMAEFFGGRIFTLVIEEVILAVFITWLAFNAVAVKLIAQVIVIVLNYIISKVWVFG